MYPSIEPKVESLGLRTLPMFKDLQVSALLVCIMITPSPTLKKFSTHFSLALAMSLFHSCSDESVETVEKETLLNTVVEQKNPPVSKVSPDYQFPVVYVEELDQFQEFFKEQHETSFSHLANKNWMSYTAGKDGILTKILLFGKPNYMVSEHYGSAMGGFVRAGNPKTGPKFGSWELSRDDIVNQLSGQGLAEREAGWITIRLKGEIPQEAGKTYFLICDRISEGRPWFGAFAFGDGNPYLAGRHWLHPEHDLVFRTYIGKTAEQIEREQKTLNNTSPPIKNIAVTTSPILQPPPPKPMGKTSALVESSSSAETSGNEKTGTDVNPHFLPAKTESRSNDAADNPPNLTSSETIKIVDLNSDSNSTENKKQKSLFDRLFKKTND